jgi:hypothetical protein
VHTPGHGGVARRPNAARDLPPSTSPPRPSPSQRAGTISVLSPITTSRCVIDTHSLLLDQVGFGTTASSRSLPRRFGAGAAARFHARAPRRSRTIDREARFRPTIAFPDALATTTTTGSRRQHEMDSSPPSTFVRSNTMRSPTILGGGNESSSAEVWHSRAHQRQSTTAAADRHWTELSTGNARPRECHVATSSRSSPRLEPEQTLQILSEIATDLTTRPPPKSTHADNNASRVNRRTESPQLLLPDSRIAGAS